jgi:hypothetical protein
MKLICTYLLLFFAIIITVNAISQNNCEVDYAKIPQKKIKKLITKKQLCKLINFNKLEPACYSLADSSAYSHHVKSFIIRESIETVWDLCKNTEPKEIWNGKTVQFGMLYSKLVNKILYYNDEYDGMVEGNIVFLNLRLLGGLKKIAVASEVTDINENEHSISFCYIQNGNTEGSQQIRLYKTQDGFTKITHETQSKIEYNNLQKS